MSWWSTNQYCSQWYQHYSQIYLQMHLQVLNLKSLFTPAVKYAKLLSLNACVFSSCDWATCKMCLYPSQVSLKAVSAGTGYTRFNILVLVAVFRISIFLHPFMARLYWEWTIWSFASVNNENVKTDIFLRTKII